MSGPHHWSETAANNASADPNADLRPGRPANTVLGSFRGLMATVALARDDDLGELPATLGASNVYSVTTNEGLIDIATGVNNVPAAITSPFDLRLTFSAALTGSATNVPHLKVDGFDCGPIQRHDGSALADGDIVTGVPYLVLGDMAAGTDTKVTRVRILDLTASDVKALLGGQSTGVVGSKITIPAAQNIVPSYARTKLTAFGTALDGTGGAFVWDAVNFRLVCVKAGSYLLSVALTKDMPIGVNYSYTLDICRNGASQADVKIAQTNSSIDYTPTGGDAARVIQVAAGDYFEAYATHNYGTSNPLNYWVELVAVYEGT